MPRSAPLSSLPLPVRGAACLAISGCLATAGCAPATAPPPKPVPAAVAPGGHGDHAHHDHAAEGGHKHPETLAAAIAELEGTWTAVKTALAAGEHDKADEKVHAAAHLLEDFEPLLAKEASGDAAAAGKKALEEIFACFDTLDEAVHDGAEAIKKLDVESLGGRIGEAVKTLKGLGTKEK